MTAPRWLGDLRAFWKDEGFEPEGKTFLAAVSGGLDSMAMLELFHREIPCRLHALHVNHRLRPAGEEDQAFVAEHCRRRNISLAVRILDPATRAPGQSPEMWGREWRYRLYEEERRHAGADYGMTAHQRDDAVETLCLRLWRGTGFAGLSSIPFRREQVIRPLLPVSRGELRSWLESLGTPWREDESNRDLSIPRNWVRHRLLPAWRAQEPDLDARLFALARAAARMRPSWGRWLEAEFPAAEVRRRGGIPLEWIRDPSPGSELLGRLLPVLGLERPAPELAAEILRQARIPGGRLRARVDEKRVLIAKRGILALAHEAGRLGGGGGTGLRVH